MSSADLAQISPRRRWPGRLALGVLVTLFLLGLLRLFALRFEAGDVYPPYSTLRSDALGAKAFFAALDSLPSADHPRKVTRSFRALSRLLLPPALALGGGGGSTQKAIGAGDTLFLLGLDPSAWPGSFNKTESAELEAAAKRGARIVLTFQPSDRTPTTELRGFSFGKSPSPSPSPSPKKDGSPSPAAAADEDADAVDASKQWALDFRRVRTRAEASSDAARQRQRAFPAVPAQDAPASLLSPSANRGPAISWHSAADFSLADAREKNAWRAVLVRDDRPVAVVRTYPENGGSIVLVSDSYFVSNEALRDERHPALLAWLAGAGTDRLIFDESHLGLHENPGLMTLARRYRLGGALAALALLAALFFWRNVTTLTPRRDELADSADEASAAGVAGRGAAAGFSSLLRRSVPPGALLEVCVTRWETSVAARPGTTSGQRRPMVSPEKLARLRAVLDAERAQPPRARHAPAAGYRALQTALRQTERGS